MIVLLTLFAILGALVPAATLGAPRPDSSAVQVIAADSSQIVRWTELITLQGVVEGEARVQQQRSRGDVSRTGSDLYLRRLQMAGTGDAASWLSAQFVLNVEYQGLGGSNASAAVLLDEGHLDVTGAGSSPYLVFGTRSQPFGQFHSQFVTDPLTQQAYELKIAGLTLGHAGPRGLDGSLTLYKGTAHLDGLFTAGFFDTTRVRRQPTSVAHVDAFVAAAEAVPFHDLLTLFAALASEPGSNHRNLSFDAGASLALSRPGFVFDVEWIRGLQRETYEGAGRPYRDAALSVTGSYVFKYIPHFLHHRRTFAGRRASIRSHPLVAAIRYDAFDDDGLAADLGGWSLRDRASVGGRYTWYRAGIASLYGMVELGSTRYRGTATRGGLAHRREALLRLGLIF